MSGKISRRTFVVTGGAVLALGFIYAKFGRPKVLLGDPSLAEGTSLNPWVFIDERGKVTLVTHRAEMGQGAFSAVPQMLAEELEVDLADIEVVMATGDGKRYGNQVTGGSTTVRGGLQGLLVTGATARDLLVRAAANRWGVPAADCRAEKGTVIHAASDRRLTYGELVADAAALKPAKDVPLKPRSQYHTIGKPLPRLDVPAKVNGTAQFGIDVRIPGMLYAVVARNPRFVGPVKRFDPAPALAVPGVKHVVKVTRDVFGHQREGVAVVATSTWAAKQGRDALVVEWDDTGVDPVDNAALYDRMRAATQADVIQYKAAGDAEAALGTAGDVLDVTYETPYQAHASMEPLNCTAHVTDGKCEVWGPIQGPDWIRSHLATALGLEYDDVTVHMTFLGGGFGRKAFPDYPHEAAMVSKAVGAPVQVVWTREDDLTAGPFRPGMTYRLRGGLQDGRLAALDVRVAGQNMDQQNPGADTSKFNGSILEGLPEAYLEKIPDHRIGDRPLASPVPVMWWRSVYSSTNAFAYESFFDEAARAAGADPMAFRRAHADDPRLHALLDRLAEVSGWAARRAGDGWGMSLTHCFDSYCGHVVQVARAPGGGVRVERATAVMDCGLVLNPDVARAQVEGSIVMALGAATVHETTFVAGRAERANFDRYPMPLLRDIPPIDVHFIENDAAPGGVGEPGLPGFAPALVNAIFDLTGTRIRRLPFDLRQV